LRISHQSIFAETDSNIISRTSLLQAFAATGAVLTFFGFMYGQSIGLAVTPTVAVAYAIVAVFLFGLSRYPVLASATIPSVEKAIAGTPAE
jgi:adenine/guanine/hypoxanthine permease